MGRQSGPVSGVWQYDAGANAWSNSGAANSLFAATKTTPAIGVGEAMWIRGRLRWLNNSAANQGLTLAPTFAGTSLGTMTVPVQATSASVHRVYFEIMITCKNFGTAGGLTGGVLLDGRVSVSVPTAATFDAIAATTTELIGSSTGTTVTTDGTSGSPIDITCAMSTATATSTITPGGITIIYFSRLA